MYIHTYVYIHLYECTYVHIYEQVGRLNGSAAALDMLQQAAADMHTQGLPQDMWVYNCAMNQLAKDGLVAAAVALLRQAQVCIYIYMYD